MSSQSPFGSSRVPSFEGSVSPSRQRPSTSTTRTGLDKRQASRRSLLSSSAHYLEEARQHWPPAELASSTSTDRDANLNGAADRAIEYPFSFESSSCTQSAAGEARNSAPAQLILSETSPGRHSETRANQFSSTATDAQIYPSRQFSPTPTKREARLSIAPSPPRPSSSLFGIERWEDMLAEHERLENAKAGDRQQLTDQTPRQTSSETVFDANESDRRDCRPLSFVPSSLREELPSLDELWGLSDMERFVLLAGILSNLVVGSQADVQLARSRLARCLAEERKMRVNNERQQEQLEVNEQRMRAGSTPPASAARGFWNKLPTFRPRGSEQQYNALQSTPSVARNSVSLRWTPTAFDVKDQNPQRLLKWSGEKPRLRSQIRTAEERHREILALEEEVTNLEKTVATDGSLLSDHMDSSLPFAIEKQREATLRQSRHVSTTPIVMECAEHLHKAIVSTAFLRDILTSLSYERGGQKSSASGPRLMTHREAEQFRRLQEERCERWKGGWSCIEFSLQCLREKVQHLLPIISEQHRVDQSGRAQTTESSFTVHPGTTTLVKSTAGAFPKVKWAKSTRLRQSKSAGTIRSHASFLQKPDGSQPTPRGIHIGDTSTPRAPQVTREMAGSYKSFLAELTSDTADMNSSITLLEAIAGSPTDAGGSISNDAADADADAEAATYAHTIGTPQYRAYSTKSKRPIPAPVSSRREGCSASEVLTQSLLTVALHISQSSSISALLFMLSSPPNSGRRHMRKYEGILASLHISLTGMSEIWEGLLAEWEAESVRLSEALIAAMEETDQAKEQYWRQRGEAAVHAIVGG